MSSLPSRIAWPERSGRVRVEPVRQLGVCGHLIGNARVANLRLGADDALRQRGRRDEERVGDLLGREAAHLAQRKGNLCFRRQGRVAAGEDQPQPVVLDALSFPRRGAIDGGDRLGDIVQRLETRSSANTVDRLETSGRYEPRMGIGGHTIPRPLLHRRPEGIMQRLLGEVEVAEQADQSGKDAARLGSIDGVHPLAHPIGGALAHRRIPGYFWLNSMWAKQRYFMNLSDSWLICCCRQ